MIGNTNELENKIMEIYHDSHSKGHLGVTTIGKKVATIMY